MMRFILLSILITALVSCTEETPVPKPPTYLRLDLPDHTYTVYEDDCPYTLSVADIYNVKPIAEVAQGQNPEEATLSCHKDIDLGPLNGTMHLSYIDMDQPLSAYVNFVNDKVDEHKVLASGINDWKIVDPEKRVFCTFFELQGDVASPYQFYLTDSTDRFVSGVVYFNSVPNYDSLKPTLDYLKVDLEYMIKNFEWKD